MRLLADDPIGRARESGDAGAYAAAFAAVEADPNNLLFVVETDGEVAGCAQLTLIPGLSRGGMWRGLIEAVRVAAGRQGEGLGRFLMGELIRTARERGCGLLQLTSDKDRPEAHRFYESLGFEASHLGFKLRLS